MRNIHRFILYGEYNKALSEIEKISNYQNNPILLSLKSRVFELTGKFERALETSERAINLSKLPEDLLNSKISLLYANWRLKRFKECIEIEKTVDLEEADYSSSLVGSFCNISGLIQWSQSNIDRAIERFQTALLHRENAEEEELISYTLNNLGNCYLSSGKLDEAEDLFKKSLQLRENLELKPGIAASYNSFGRINDAKTKFDIGLDYHKKSLDLWIEIDNKQFIAKSYRFIGSNYLNQAEFIKAIVNFQISFQLFKEIGNEIDAMVSKQLLDQISGQNKE